MDKDRSLFELPLSTLAFGKLRVPVGGGGYMRLCPRWLYSFLVRRIAHAGDGLCLYTHPWEMDVDQPRIELKFPDRYMHYLNLHSTRPKLERIFASYRFMPAAEAYAAVSKH